jgi:hypothetical protein
MSSAIPIREVKDILDICFKKDEWDKIKEQRQEEIISGLYRKIEIIHSDARSEFAITVIDFLKRC